MQLQLETYIAAPPDRVFARLADIPRWPETISAITSVDMLTPGAVDVGTRFRETRMMFGRQATEEMVVAEMLAPSRLVLTAESHGTRYRAVHSIEAEGEGTRLKIIFEGKPVTLTARLMSPLGTLMKSAVEKHMRGDMEDLKQAIEEEAKG